MNPDHLLDVAEDILRMGGGTPRQAQINRAISTAYYALFHAICQLCVSSTVGRPKARYWNIVLPLLRSVDHGAARRTFGKFAADPASSGGLKGISRSFIELQAARIAADYDPSPEARATRREAIDLVDEARTAVVALSDLSGDERLLLAVHRITKQR